MKLITVIRARVASLYFVVPMCCAIFFLSVPTYASNGPGRSSYTGEQYFQGVFFGEGPVAAAIPALADLSIRNFTSNPDNLQNVATFQANLLNQISQNNPAFFANFKIEMESRNQIRILSAMDGGKNAVLDAMAKMYNCRDQADLVAQASHAANEFNLTISDAPTKDELTKLANQNLSQPIKLNSGEPEIVALIAILIIVAVVWAAVYYKVKLWEAANGEESQLFREQVANSLSRL